jgi:general stress protein 26
MVVETLAPPDELLDAFVATAHRIVWCTVATVDRRGRPRSRVLHPYWEREGDRLTGWIVTRRSPLKAAHLARTPYVSCTYWDATHDVAIADCRAEWVEDAGDRAHAWALFAAAPEPLGYDFHQIWPGGPDAPGSAALRLEPWRMQTADAMTVTTPRAWRAGSG